MTKLGNNIYGFKLINAEVLDGISAVPDKSVQLIITSPPYNLDKEYEKGSFNNLDDYLGLIGEVVDALVPKLSDTGSICWQVGNCVSGGEVFPIDILTYNMFKKHGLKLRNRIVWQFNFGLNSKRRLSGRYETILWFTKSDDYVFNLDPIRIAQKYPGKRHSSSKGVLAGQPSGNPKGKNPSDFWLFDANREFLDHVVWQVPNVKANHPEKTIHPCQFPIELVERCVLALTKPGDLVLDPF